MRIEIIDRALIRALDEIRKKEWRVQGRGHSDTVRFLADYYLKHKSVEEILDERLSEISNMMEEGALNAFRTVLTNLLRSEKKET